VDVTLSPADSSRLGALLEEAMSGSSGAQRQLFTPQTGDQTSVATAAAVADAAAYKAAAAAIESPVPLFASPFIDAAAAAVVDVASPPSAQRAGLPLPQQQAPSTCSAEPEQASRSPVVGADDVMRRGVVGRLDAAAMQAAADAGSPRTVPRRSREHHRTLSFDQPPPLLPPQQQPDSSLGLVFSEFASLCLTIAS
jgi:hypothetical protein